MTNRVAVGRVTTPRRPELERAFQHLAGLAAAADLSSISDSAQRDLVVQRSYAMPRYGDVGPAVSMAGVSIERTSADGVPAVWLTVHGGNHAHRIVYLHGGGWRSGSPDHYFGLAATLARLSGASILLVDYRLAPEDPYPAGLDDCQTAYMWALTHGPQTGRGESVGNEPADRIFLAGDSAGGNLAAATCLRLCAADLRAPDRLVLIAGTLDNVETERRVGIDDVICTLDAFAACNRHYLPDGHHPSDPYVSPVFAPEELLSKFPPTLLQVSSIEALAWDSKQFAARLESAQVRVNLSLWPDLPHVWHQFLGLFPEAREAIEEIADFLSR